MEWLYYLTAMGMKVGMRQGRNEKAPTAIDSDGLVAKLQIFGIVSGCKAQ
jgi:hypothetical protein|tara:strand:+ start:47 stop:196 length:150 start_codon:yes stop_codon:yes gene_type:complete